MVGPMPYPRIYMPEQEGPRTMSALRSTFVDHIDLATAQSMLDHLNASNAPMRIAQFRVLGGEMARVPADATAFAHRSARVLIAYIAIYGDPAETPAHEAWVADALADLPQDGGVYVNFIANDSLGRVNDAYPSATQARLAALKAK